MELQLKSALKRSSAVVSLGPGKVGKTTLTKKIIEELPGAIYIQLEKNSDLRRLNNGEGSLLQQNAGLTVLDEVPSPS